MPLYGCPQVFGPAHGDLIIYDILTPSSYQASVAILIERSASNPVTRVLSSAAAIIKLSQRLKVNLLMIED